MEGMGNLSPDDFYRLRFVSDPQASGGRVAFVSSAPDRKADDYSSSIWVHDGRARRFTRGGKDSMPRWSPGGRSLAFVSRDVQSKKSRLMVMPSDGGEAEEICSFEGEIDSLLWSPDGRRLFFIGTARRGEEIKRFGRYPFYFNAKGFLHDRESHLYGVNLAGRVRHITSGALTVNSFDIVPGRDLLILSIRRDEWDVYTSALFSCTTGGRELKMLTPSPSSQASPAVSPEGRTIAFIHRSAGSPLYTHHRVAFIPVGGGEPAVSSGSDLNAGNGLNSDSRVTAGNELKWAADGSAVYYLSTEAPDCSIYRCDATSLKCSRALGGIGSIDSFDLVEGGFCIHTADFNHPC